MAHRALPRTESSANRLMAAIDPTGVDMQQLRAEFDAKLADTAHRNAEARKFDAETVETLGKAKWHPLLVFASLFGAGSAFTLVIGAVVQRLWS